ncbi:cytochrome D ABC transporter, ATP-binding and permease [Levilactobacillus senmaizukei DSM 21775 = NBRC 103853]|uniref:Cytochrome D ABC transporter, ATP-binding and permease n=1 Tax=Levilactobacillus senmaizukei DSM 21775 = NBRC 103853 TaxID=1423803 RepID=A0A0R2DJ18_9LACO|nr:thiol reductant ABC exporter subunit CydD [Levilactobacillus senmaizukei]KRN03099.1 cytochrome D ABC transporter, ATP-binding and permease [Levilactobacillus senmaizukei DSM 21775 = NBRC 103853]
MIDQRVFKFPGVKPAAAIAAVLTLIQAVMIILQAVYLSAAIVHLWHQQAIGTIVQPLAVFAVTFLARHLLTIMKSRTLYPFVEQTTKTLRKQFMGKLFDLGPQVVAQNGTGNVVTMGLEGIDKIQTYLMMIIGKVLDLSLTPWLVLIYIATIRWQAAVFLLAIYPLIILFMVILGLAAQAKADRQYAGYQRLSNHFVDTLRGLPTLKQLGLNERYADNVYHVSEDYRKKTMATLTIAMTSTFALDFFTTLSIAIIAVFLGFGLMDNTLQLLPALIILTLAPDYFAPIRNFANDYHATLNGKNALTAVLDILQQPVPKDRNLLPEKAPVWTAGDELCFDRVSVAYGDAETTLTDLSFKVKGFEKVGIIGASGSGKSTLINTLGGFLSPQAGTIQVRGTQVPHLDQTSWRQSFVYIPQAPYLFHASLRDNLAFYHPQAGLAAIETAAKRAGLSDWIATLPAGLDTAIGEGARGVSGGQAQRIALARAFLDDRRRVLLFDEPTAHLDIETEIELKQAMMPVFDNHLVFFATHRLHWMNEMDYILVMDHGRIVEQGTPTELAQQNGAYVRLRAEMGGGVKP